jgi:pimeloyl-ACP methyl ester carboxylesterase
MRSGIATAGAQHETVVLLHASASSSRQWSALAQRLASRFDVRAVDFHGHGARGPWQGRGPLALADEVALVEPIIREKGSVHLVGHSYGGAVALKIASMHPSGVRTLAVFEPVLFRWLLDLDPYPTAAREVLEVVDDIRRSLRCANGRLGAERFVNYWAGDGAWARLPRSRQDPIAARMPAVLSHFDALFGEPLLLPDAVIPLPILCMSGTQSPRSTRRIAEIAHRMLPTASHEAMAGMGHMGPMTHAATFDARIERFLLQARDSAAAGRSLRAERGLRDDLPARTGSARGRRGAVQWPSLVAAQ